MKNCIYALMLVGLIWTIFPTPGMAIQQEEAPVFRTEVEVVNVICTVRHKNRYITDLTREDFACCHKEPIYGPPFDAPCELVPIRAPWLRILVLSRISSII